MSHWQKYRKHFELEIWALPPFLTLPFRIHIYFSPNWSALSIYFITHQHEYSNELWPTPCRKNKLLRMNAAKVVYLATRNTVDSFPWELVHFLMRRGDQYGHTTRTNKIKYSYINQQQMIYGPWWFIKV